ncbi:hypothetical protein [Thaumasiovibrio sp. DFM-14]|uniref:hypothetical protein n=1 Tax=Thaumasiovibrio sp. DFM-14 TaxID=3384792 RepID=UPI0039A2C75A
MKKISVYFIISAVLALIWTYCWFHYPIIPPYISEHHISVFSQYIGVNTNEELYDIMLYIVFIGSFIFFSILTLAIEKVLNRAKAFS